MAEDFTYNVLNMQGEKVESINLDPTVFMVPLRADLVHSVVRWQRAKRRAGTHSALNRAAMKGGGRKPFRQKGTGNARAGSNNSPLWVGGAVTHGPRPRSYEFALPKKVRRSALATVLTAKAQKKHLIILDQLEVASGKTKDMSGILKQLGVVGNQGGVVLTSKQDTAIWRASKNLPKVKTLLVDGANVYDLLRFRYLICTKDAVENLQMRVKNSGRA